MILCFIVCDDFQVDYFLKELGFFQLISGGGAISGDLIDGSDESVIAVACDYYSKYGKLSNDHLIRYLELNPQNSYVDLENSCKQQVTNSR